MPSSFLHKKYTLVKSENFDAYMKELGVGFTLRKMGNTVSSQCLLTKIGNGIYTFWLKTPLQCHKIDFKPDKPFAEITIDNRVVKTTCSLKGNIFVQEQRAPGLKTTKIIREYRNNGNDLITTLFVGDVKAVRYYVDTKEIAYTLDHTFPVQKKPVKRMKTVRKYKSKASKLCIKPSAKTVMAEKYTDTMQPITNLDGNINSVKFNEDANKTEQCASGSKPTEIPQKSEAKKIDSVLVEDIASVVHNVDQKKNQKPKPKRRKCC